MKQTAFFAVTTEQLRRLTEAGSEETGSTVAAFSATEELKGEFGYRPDEEEDADYAALCLAGVQALVDQIPRLVLAVQVAPEQIGGGEPADHGAVALSGVTWPQAHAIFVEDPGSAAAATALSRSLVGTSITNAWADGQVRQFVAEHELLWFATQEWVEAAALINV